jgi:hypothetical protein
MSHPQRHLPAAHHTRAPARQALRRIRRGFTTHFTCFTSENFLFFLFLRCPPHPRASLDKLFGAFVEAAFSFTAQFTCFTSTNVPLRMRQGACRAGALAWWANNMYYIYLLYVYNTYYFIPPPTAPARLLEKLLGAFVEAAFSLLNFLLILLIVLALLVQKGKH